MPVKEDIADLQRLVRFVGDILEFLTPIADEQFRRGRAAAREASFRKALPDTLVAVTVIHNELAQVTTEDDLRWKGLQAVGLTGSSLQLKKGVLERLIEAFRGSFFRILQWINSFLGSLGSVPVFGVACDLIKEYKEMMELFVRFLHRVPKPPKKVFDLA